MNELSLSLLRWIDWKTTGIDENPFAPKVNPKEFLSLIDSVVLTSEEIKSLLKALTPLEKKVLQEQKELSSGLPHTEGTYDSTPLYPTLERDKRGDYQPTLEIWNRRRTENNELVPMVKNLTKALKERLK